MPDNPEVAINLAPPPNTETVQTPPTLEEQLKSGEFYKLSPYERIKEFDKNIILTQEQRKQAEQLRRRIYDLPDYLRLQATPIPDDMFDRGAYFHKLNDFGEFANSEVDRVTIIKTVSQLLSPQNYDNLGLIRQQFNLTNQELTQAAELYTYHNLSLGRKQPFFTKLNIIIPLPDDFFEDPTIRHKAASVLAWKPLNPQYTNIDDGLAERLNLSKQEIETATFDVIQEQFAENKFDNIVKLSSYVHSNELKQELITMFDKEKEFRIKNNNWEGIEQLYQINPAMFTPIDIQTIQSHYIESIGRGNLKLLNERIPLINQEPDINDPIIQQYIQFGIYNALNNNAFFDIARIKNQHPEIIKALLKQPRLQQMAETKILEMANSDNFNLSLFALFHIRPDFITSEKVFPILMSEVKQALDINDVLNLDYLRDLAEVYPQIQHQINSDPEVIEKSQTLFERYLSVNQPTLMTSAVGILETFGIPTEYLHSPQIQEKVINQFSVLLTNDSEFNYIALPYVTRLLKLVDQPEVFKQQSIYQSLLVKSLYKELNKQYIDQDAIQEIQSQFNDKTRQIIDYNNDLFGIAASYDTVAAVRGVIEGPISESLSNLGIKQVGEKGLKELSDKITEIRHQILEDKIDPELIMSNTLVTAIFKNAVGYESSQFGSHTDQDFINMINNYQLRQTEGTIKPLDPTYQPSETLRIKTIKSDVEFQYSEGFLNRFQTLKDSIQAGLTAAESDKPLELILKNIDTKVSTILVDLNAQLSRLADKPQAVANIQKQIDRLTKLDLSSGHDFQSKFMDLAPYKELAPELRQAIFTLVLHRLPEARERARNYLQHLEKNPPGIDDISWMLDLIDHVTNKETAPRYLKNKAAVRKFFDITDTKAISDELSRIQNQDIIGTTPIQFSPSRGLQMEFSGHMADACWANKYPSIAAEFPNITTVTMIKNPEDPKLARIVGSALLIEGESAEGEPLLIVRGLNPSQTLIRDLSVEDFFEQFMNYVGGIAQKTNRKVVVVIDHTGAASTNRPLIADHESKLPTNRIPLSNKINTTFNGYDLSQKCFEVLPASTNPS